MWRVKTVRNSRGIPDYYCYNDNGIDKREFLFDCERWAQECANSLNKLEEKEGEE